jgi:hypothetical protein
MQPVLDGPRLSIALQIENDSARFPLRRIVWVPTMVQIAITEVVQGCSAGRNQLKVEE